MIKEAAKYCYRHHSGKDIFLYTLRNRIGTEVLVTNFGAIVSSFKIKMANENFNDIVLGFDRVEDYEDPAYLAGYPWFGAAIGRYANRIKDAAFTIDNKNFRLTKNNGNDQLHGGVSGFDKKVWDCIAQGEEPQPWLELNYKSPDGEEGYPGNLDLSIRFELTDENELSYAYTAVGDKATAVNLTHHDYFNLDNGAGTINGNEIKIYSAQILEQDAALICTGNLSGVEGTGFDLRAFTRIGEGLKKTGDYDKSFLADEREDHLVAEARSLQSGTLLQVYSTNPVVHFYTGKWIPEVKGKQGILYGPYSGFCLETQQHPNAINIPHFPNTVLRPGEVYRQKTIYKVIV